MRKSNSKQLPLLEVVSKIRAKIDAHYDGKDFERFHHIAYEALAQQQEKLMQLGLQDFYDTLIQVESLDRQTYPGPAFSEVPVTFFCDLEKKYTIEMYYWRSADTAVHDHAFSGAFCLFSGMSLQSNYRFEYEKNISSDLETGKLLHLETSGVKPGDLVKVAPGEKFIHQINHLCRPTLTFMIRSFGKGFAKHQYRYIGNYRNVFGEPKTKQSKLSQLLRSLLIEDPAHPQIEPTIAAMESSFLIEFSVANLSLLASNEWVKNCIRKRTHAAEVEALETILSSSFEQSTRIKIQQSFCPEEKLLSYLLLNANSSKEVTSSIQYLFPERDVDAFVVENFQSIYAAGAIEIKAPDILADMLRPSLHALEDREYLHTLGNLGWSELVKEQASEIIALRKQSKQIKIFNAFL